MNNEIKIVVTRKIALTDHLSESMKSLIMLLLIILDFFLIWRLQDPCEAKHYELHPSNRGLITVEVTYCCGRFSGRGMSRSTILRKLWSDKFVCI